MASRRKLHRGKPDVPALPPAFQDTGDPVTGNPFPASRKGHEVWKRATLRAEEELARLNSESIENRPTRDGFAAFMEPGGGSREHQNWFLAQVAAKFDIWAKRYLSVVQNEKDLQGYDQWLFSYANDWAKKAASHVDKHDLQASLIARLEHWKAEARHQLNGLNERRNMADAKETPETSFTHSEDYRSVTLRGKVYTLTSQQAGMIGILHEAHKGGRPDVSIAAIMEGLDSPNSRWQDTFKKNTDARKALIVAGNRKGTIRLNA